MQCRANGFSRQVTSEFKTWSTGGCTTPWRTMSPWRKLVHTTSSPISAGGRCSGTDNVYNPYLGLQESQLLFLDCKNFHWYFFRFFETKTSGPLPNRFSLPLPRRLKRWLKAKICRERERSRPALSSVSVQDLTKWSGLPFHLPNLMNLKAGYNEVSQLLRLCVPWISWFSLKWLNVTVVTPMSWQNHNVPAVTWHDQCHELNPLKQMLLATYQISLKHA